MKKPDLVRVGAFDIEILTMEDKEAMAHGIHGHYSSCEQTIRINKSLPKLKYIDTLMHEILHSAYDVGNLEDDDDEEKTVSVLASILTQVLRDNPKFIEYLHKELHGKSIK